MKYADPKLESRVRRQKLLMRMGSDNAKVIKQKLRELRGEIVAKQLEPELDLAFFVYSSSIPQVSGCRVC